jgi:hypothetical protein
MKRRRGGMRPKRKVKNNIFQKKYYFLFLFSAFHCMYS